MESFVIESSHGLGTLTFSDRSPFDSNLPIGSFMTHITVENLEAAAQVSGGYSNDHPASLFSEMEERWQGWPGELIWRSVEGELTLRCNQDRTGHVSIRVELRNGRWEDDWRVEATIMAEAGQLERLSRHARAFFGQTG